MLHAAFFRKWSALKVMNFDSSLILFITVSETFLIHIRNYFMYAINCFMSCYFQDKVLGLSKTIVFSEFSNPHVYTPTLSLISYCVCNVADINHFFSSLERNIFKELELLAF